MMAIILPNHEIVYEYQMLVDELRMYAAQLTASVVHGSRPGPQTARVEFL